jgi:hypothetical protein
MIREWILNNVINCPVRDKILVELEMPPTLRRAVGTQLISYFVPNGTKGVMRGGSYQYCVPTGLTRQMQKNNIKK